MNQNILFTVIVFALTFTILNTSNSFGKIQTGDIEKTISENEIKSFITGLRSNNSGLIKSCIHYVGLYKISKAVDPLIEILNDPSQEFMVKVLSVISLYNIGDENGMNAIKNASLQSKDTKIKNMCTAIYHDYLENRAKYFTINP